MEIRIQISFSPEMENQKREFNWIELRDESARLPCYIVSEPFSTRNTHCYLNINWLRLYIAQQNDTAIEIVALSLFRSKNIWNTWDDRIDIDILGRAVVASSIPIFLCTNKQFTFYWCCVKCVLPFLHFLFLFLHFCPYIYAGKRTINACSIITYRNQHQHSSKGFCCVPCCGIFDKTRIQTVNSSWQLPIVHCLYSVIIKYKLKAIQVS